MAKKEGKRLTEFRKKIENKLYTPENGFRILTENAKPTEAIDIAVTLGIDGKKSDQVVKGVVEHMPAGLGKKITIGLFAKADLKAAQEAGADHVGFEDLFEKVKNEEIDCDVYLATMDVMPELAKMGLGRILKGKMPNPKFGTVVEAKNVVKAIKDQKAGQLAFRSNLSVVHVSIGRASFKVEDLISNYTAFLQTLKSVKPSVIKPHNYFKRIFISSTMGPGIELELSSSLKDVKG